MPGRLSTRPVLVVVVVRRGGAGRRSNPLLIVSGVLQILELDESKLGLVAAIEIKIQACLRVVTLADMYCLTMPCPSFYSVLGAFCRKRDNRGVEDASRVTGA